MPRTILIRYAEIGLKGGNRNQFEDQLIRNIRRALGVNLIQIVKEYKQFVIKAKEPALEKLKKVFGIAWFAPVTQVKNEPKAVEVAALQLVRPKKSFAVRAHHDLEVKLGEAIRLKKKIKVDLDNPEQTIYVVGLKDKVLVFNQKIAGPGGLPVGSSGKVLCLLSGGFDSVAAAYLMAKRGARVDFLHFHVFTSEQPVLKSKVKTICDSLCRFTLSSKLYLGSYLPFQMQVLDLAKNEVRQELIIFRRLMVQVGQALAQKHGYQALVLGDSLGQVASQTMENIVAVDAAVAVPIFRPLIGFDKNETINIVRKIGLEETVNQPYKDCCSLVATHPATRANMAKILSLEKKFKIGEIIKSIAGNVEVVNF